MESTLSFVALDYSEPCGGSIVCMSVGMTLFLIMFVIGMTGLSMCWPLSDEMLLSTVPPYLRAKAESTRGAVAAIGGNFSKGPLESERAPK